jgi:hypothetical protein
MNVCNQGKKWPEKDGSEELETEGTRKEIMERNN